MPAVSGFDIAARARRESCSAARSAASCRFFRSLASLIELEMATTTNNRTPAPSRTAQPFAAPPPDELAAEGLGGATGWGTPQCGQVAASVLTCFLHSRQGLSAMKISRTGRDVRG